MRRTYGSGHLYVKSGAYYVRWRAPNGRYLNRRVGKMRTRGKNDGLTRAEAERAARRLVEQQSIERSATVQERPPTVDEVADQLRDRLAVEGVRLSYLQNCDSMQRIHISPAIGKRRVESVERQDIERLARAMLARGRGRRDGSHPMGESAAQRRPSASPASLGVVPPAQHAKRAERDPAGGSPFADLELEPDTTGEPPVQRPGSVGAAPRTHVLHGLQQARVAPARAAEVVERPQHVVVPAARVRELQVTRSRRLAGAQPPQEPALQQVLLARPTRGDADAGRVLIRQQPSSTLITLSNDERTEACSRPQFQPQSSSRSPAASASPPPS
jgi:hypothetical protein